MNLRKKDDRMVYKSKPVYQPRNFYRFTRIILTNFWYPIVRVAERFLPHYIFQQKGRSFMKLTAKFLLTAAASALVTFSTWSMIQLLRCPRPQYIVVD